MVTFEKNALVIKIETVSHHYDELYELQTALIDLMILRGNEINTDGNESRKCLHLLRDMLLTPDQLPIKLVLNS